MLTRKRMLSKHQVTLKNILAKFGIGYPIGEYVLPYKNQTVELALKLTPTAAELCQFEPLSRTWRTVSVVADHQGAIAAWKRVQRTSSGRGYEYVNAVFIEGAFNSNYWNEMGFDYV